MGSAKLGIAVSALVLALSACGSGGGSGTTALTTSPASSASGVVPSGTPVDLPVSDWTPDQMGYALYINGTLIIDGDCIRLKEKRDGSVTTLIWPKGSTARRVGNVITVYAAAGRAVAASGDAVLYDGGYGEPPYDL
ncbi:MAG: hypothetical protein NT180_02785 [Actinobacteria bacterium]|nr:hypothetical protein [Actinomycetota bacterium]